MHDVNLAYRVMDDPTTEDWPRQCQKPPGGTSVEMKSYAIGMRRCHGVPVPCYW